MPILGGQTLKAVMQDHNPITAIILVAQEAQAAPQLQQDKPVGVGVATQIMREPVFR